MKTKDLILKQAYELFQEKSYSEVSIDDICNKCRLTKPAFYYHFSSKAELLSHYYDDVVAHIHKTLAKKTVEDNYWEQYIFCFSELIFASVNLGADLISHLYIANLTTDKGSFDFNESFSSLSIHLIEKAQESGQILNSQKAQNLFISSSFMFTGFEVFWGIKKGSFDRQHAVVAALETIFDVNPAYSLQESVLLEFESFR